MKELARVLMLAALATVVASAQTPTPTPQRPGLPGRPAQTPPKPTPPAQTGQVFRGGTDLIGPIDVMVRDGNGAFIPDLSAADFQVFEDGVEQKIANFTKASGGSFYNDLAVTAPTRSSEGLILPKAAPKVDTATRIFIIFIDDLHIMAAQTPEVRRMLQLIRDTVVHENDLVGFVSSGTSSIEMDPAYDPQHRRFNEAINKTMGGGPTINEMIAMQAGQDGLSELNHNQQVAFMAANNLLTQMEDIRGMRKAFIWVSNGYSLDPFKDSRLKKEFERYANSGVCGDQSQKDPNTQQSDSDVNRRDPCSFANIGLQDIQNLRDESGFDIFGHPTLQWKTGDLMTALAELIRTANRANVMFFPIDPRGLIAGFNTAAMQSPLSAPEERDFIMQTQGTLRALAENTGGIACVGTNDCRPVLQRIDNMLSDYYMIGYRTSNPDPFKLARKIEIKVKRPGVQLVGGRDYRDTYYLKRPPKEKK